MVLTLENRRQKKGFTYREIQRLVGIDKTTAFFHHKGQSQPGIVDTHTYSRLYGCSMEAIYKGWVKAQAEGGSR